MKKHLMLSLALSTAMGAQTVSIQAKPAKKMAGGAMLKAGARAQDGENCKIGKVYRIGKSRPMDLQLLKVEVKSKLAFKTMFGSSETLESGDYYRFVVVHYTVSNPNSAPVAFFSTPDSPGQRPVLNMGLNSEGESGDAFTEIEPRTFAYGSNKEFGSTSQNRRGNDVGAKKSMRAWTFFRVPRKTKPTQLMLNYSLHWQGATPSARDSSPVLAQTLMTFDISGKVPTL